MTDWWTPPTFVNTDTWDATTANKYLVTDVQTLRRYQRARKLFSDSTASNSAGVDAQVGATALLFSGNTVNEAYRMIVRIWFTARAPSGTPNIVVSIKDQAGTLIGAATPNIRILASTTKVISYGWSASVDVATPGSPVNPGFQVWMKPSVANTVFTWVGFATLSGRSI